ncbi:hypothetical protein ASPZODRAFT_127032 [Penicilliopsis zonata CBS 506.65]|uniref:Uncharacterized protein n=1 Tax=Penicilliopsis zonata CBS 506.65 TaxID=1073090 RepID=A0A1L9SV66_9EURO|nr:hypothetical protein ASPZODRAFT_127032 [Penicilliopsis zonata CBS 506.65]OJJ51036.1 hypothetical protein ASPZODRAFT_127032 [Penicilliopsis zonata CBS 506.65]
MHHPRLADFFEDFTRPHTSQSALASSPQHHPTASGVTYGSSSSPTSVPSYLPIEEIYVPPQFQPPNPEDEDDVVPDQHAAFGITRAMERRRDPVWRDLGLDELVSGLRLGVGSEGVKGVRVREGGKLMGGKRVVCLR